ncbi:MAG TPA: hypothetical protein VKB53_12985 [Gammaproteobacteria bacterium]|nr:hypothetical protein [Gammaproteobacteria bacterium]
MTVSQYAVLVTLIFALGAAVQMMISAAVPVVVGETRPPMWASSVAFGFAIIFACFGYATLG